jgi:hypothetical protein
MTTPILGMQELIASQTQPHIPINTALRVLEANSQISVLAVQVDPPLTAAEGDRYIVDGSASPGPTGDWAGHENELAVVIGGGWTFLAPLDGWIAYSVGAARFYFYDSTVPGWVALFARGVPLIEMSTDLTLDSVHNGSKIVCVDGVSPGLTLTVPRNDSNALSTDHTTTIINMNVNPLTIVVEAGSPDDIIYFAQDGDTAARSLAQFGMATLTKISATTWMITGVGLT